MKRSEINRAYQRAQHCFRMNGWSLPPNAQWDITDFGLGDFARVGLTLINLANEPEYCEKVMYACKGQKTPCHTHVNKKEDIICRAGRLSLWLWSSRPLEDEKIRASTEVIVPINGIATTISSGSPYVLEGGCRVTLLPGIWHAFAPASEECVIGEVSTANDDLHDNLFADTAIGRFPGIEEDEPAELRLLSE